MSNSIDRFNKLNDYYNKKTINIKDENGETKIIKLDIFKEGMAVSNDVKEVLSKFNTNKDSKIDKQEALTLKKMLYDYSGSDKILDENEILSIFGLTKEDKNAEKVLTEFRTMVNRQLKGEYTTTTSQTNGSVTTTSLRDDGSGIIITTSKDENGNPVKITQTFGKGNILIKKTIENKKGTTISEYTNNEVGKPVKIVTTEINTEGKLQTEKTEDLTYNNDGKILTRETEVKHHDKKKVANGITITPTDKISVSNEYNENGKLTKRTIVEGNNKKPKTTVATFNDKEQISHQVTTEEKLIFTVVNGKRTFLKQKINSTYDWTYTQDGKKATLKRVKTDNSGKESIANYTYAEDGETIKTIDAIFYSRGAKNVEHYEGANLKNRTGVPSEAIVYEADGKTIIRRTVNKFDEDGILIGREVYDKDNKLISQHDFSKVDGNFEISNQKSRGDCYLLAAINSLTESEAGHSILKQNLKISTDANGKKVYTISFPGAKEVKRELMAGITGSKIPEDKIFIKDSYTITEDELKQAALKAGAKYSVGDKDVLLMEVAYEKLRIDTFKTRKENKIPATTNFHGFGIFTSDKIKQNDYLSGGQPEDAQFLITGKKAEFVSLPNKEIDKLPVLYVDSDYQMHLTDNNGNIIDIKAKGMNPKITKMLDKLEQDSKDGKLDNFAACANFKVASQEVNGKIINGNLHALTITKVDKDNVYLANPWDPEAEVVMTRADFEASCARIGLLPVNSNGDQEITDLNNSQNTGNQNTQIQHQRHKPNYKVKKNEGYTSIIKRALIQQGIPATDENIRIAKKQFEKENPGAVHKYKGKRKEWHNNKFLYVNAEIYIPNFKIK